MQGKYRLKSEVSLFVKMEGSNGLDFAPSKLDNLTERSVLYLPIQLSRVKAAPDSSNLLELGFKTPPIAVVCSIMRSMTVQISEIEPCSYSKITMIAPPLELCFELGYHEGIEHLPSRGPPKLLLDDLKAFAEDRPFSGSRESLSAAYLAAKPAGLKHKLSKNACNLAEVLSWPKDQLMLVHT